MEGVLRQAGEGETPPTSDEDERTSPSSLMTLLATVAHDIRSPLQSAVVASALLSREELSPTGQKNLEVLRRSHDRMRRLIQDLLDFAEYERLGRLVLRRQQCDLAPVVSAVAEELRTANANTTLSVQLAGDSTGEWDPLRIGQLVTNLVNNAITHGDKSRPITVELIAEPGFSDVILRVSNEGQPIPQSFLPLLFDPFKRGEANEAPRGIGLGLAIVRQIALSHGGAVDVESTSEGTTFTVVLPRH